MIFVSECVEFNVPRDFFSFYPLDRDSSITRLRNALQLISFWMTANLLTLNSS